MKNLILLLIAFTISIAHAQMIEFNMATDFIIWKPAQRK